MKLRIWLHTGGLTGILLLSLPGEAHAYVDPGTGSYLFQLAVAGFLAAAYTLRQHFDTLRTAVLGRLRRGTGGPAAGDGN